MSDHTKQFYEYDECRQCTHYERRIDALEAENSTLRSVVALSKEPCVYCGLTDMSQCARGFPGCARADDIICGEDEGFREVVERMREAEAENAKLREALEAARECLPACVQDSGGREWCIAHGQRWPCTHGEARRLTDEALR